MQGKQSDSLSRESRKRRAKPTPHLYCRLHICRSRFAWHCPGEHFIA